MSENQADYLAGNGYITEAEDMLGAGYDQPAAIIDPPRVVRALRDKGLVDYTVWGWVKTSAKFRAHIKILRGSKHDIWHYLALGVDENGKCKETIKQICVGTGYSHTEVINTLKELDEMGYLSIQKDNKGNTYTPEFVARGENKPTESIVKKVESSPVYQVESSPAIEKSVPSIKRVKRVNGKEVDLVDGLLFFAEQGRELGVDNIEATIQELERGLRVNITRSLNNQQVAKRILKDGRPLETLLGWCKSDEWRASHLYLYADLEKVWQVWPQAFGGETGYNPQGLEIK